VAHLIQSGSERSDYHVLTENFSLAVDFLSYTTQRHADASKTRQMSVSSHSAADKALIDRFLPSRGFDRQLPKLSGSFLLVFQGPPKISGYIYCKLKELFFLPDVRINLKNDSKTCGSHFSHLQVYQEPLYMLVYVVASYAIQVPTQLNETRSMRRKK
jgi:hypothetical protein